MARDRRGEAQRVTGQFIKEQEEHQQFMEDYDRSWAKAMHGSWKYDTVTGSAANAFYLDSQAGEPDPEFKLDDYEALINQELPMSTNTEMTYLERAKNRKHLDSLLADRKEYRDFRVNAEAMGFTRNIIAQLGAEAGNAPNYALMLPYAAPKTMAKVFVNALAIGAMNTIEEKAIDLVYGEKTFSDYVMAMGVGVTFGTGLGALTKGSNIDALANNAAESKILGSGEQPKLEHVQLDDYKVDGVPTQSITDAMAVKGLDSSKDFDMTVHLAEEAGQIPKADRLPQTGTPLESLANRLQSSDNPKTRYLAGLILEHPEKTPDILNKHTAALEADAMQDMLLVPYTKAMHTMQGAYLKAASDAGVKGDFDAALKIRTNDGLDPENASPAMLKALDDAQMQYEKTGNQVHDYVRGAGTDELKDTDFDPTYMARSWDGEAMIEAANKYSDTDVKQLLKASIYKGGDFEKAHQKLMAEIEDADDLTKAFTKADNEAQSIDFEKATVLDKDGKELYASTSTSKGDVKIPQKELSEAAYLVHNHPSGMPFSKGDIKAHLTNGNIVESRIITKDQGSYVLRTLDKERAAGLNPTAVWKDVSSMLKKTDDPSKAADIYRRVINTKYKGVLQFRRAKSLNTEKNFDALATRIAEAVYNRMTKRSMRVTAGANLLAGKDQRMLMDSLEDLKLSNEDLTHIKRVLDTAGKDRRANARKPQIKLDMSATYNDLKMTDMLGNSSTYGAVANWRYWIGRGAVAKKAPFLNSEEGIAKAINDLDSTGIKAGMTPKDILYEKEALIESFKQVLGRSPFDMSGKGATTMRAVQKMVASSGLGKLGLIQFAESGRAISAITSSIPMFIPELAKLVKGIIKGKVSNDVFRDFEAYSAETIGLKRFLNHPKFRADDYGYKMSKGEELIDKMSYYTSVASGFHRVHDAQYAFVVNGLMQKWYKEMLAGTTSKLRMNDVGLSQADLTAIKGELRHVTTKKGMFGTVVDNANLDKWDVNVRSKFLLAIHRKTNNAVQSLMVGETPRWMNTPIGRFFGQFRSFSMAALGKQTTKDMRFIRRGDMEAGVALMFGMATSYLKFFANVQYNALKKDGAERDKYLKEQFETKRMLNDVLAYHGSLALPVDIINAISTMAMGIDLGGGRLNPSKGVAGLVPATRYADNIIKGVGGVLNPVDYNQADLRALFSIAPMQSVWGIDLILDKLADFMPEER